MTLIGGMGSPVGGILIADMMISSTRPIETPLSFPTMTIKPEQKTVQKKYYISRLGGKITLLSRYVAVAYAGDVVLGRSMIRVLGEKLPEGPPDPVGFAKYLETTVNEYSEFERNEVDLICLCAFKTHFKLYYSKDCELYQKLSLCTNIAAGGSGAKSFLTTLGTANCIKELQSFQFIEGADPRPMLSQCIEAINNFATIHRWDELFSGTPAEEHYGGWYEIIISHQKGEDRWLERLQNMAFILVRLQEKNGELMVEVNAQVFFQTYIKDKLVIVRPGFKAVGIVPPEAPFHVHESGERIPSSDQSVSGLDIRIDASHIHVAYALVRSEETLKVGGKLLQCEPGTSAFTTNDEFEINIPASTFAHLREIYYN